MSRRTRNATQLAGAETRRPPVSARERVEPRRRPPRGAPVERESHGFVSVWVDRAWWAPDTGLLEVAFNDRVHVLYEKVTAKEWDAFKKAGSAGQYVRDVLEKHNFRVR